MATSKLTADKNWNFVTASRKVRIEEVRKLLLESKRRLIFLNFQNLHLNFMKVSELHAP